MAALPEATHFLSPVLDRTQLQAHRNLPLLHRLTLHLPTPLPPTPPPTAPTIAHAVLTHALDLLRRIPVTLDTTDLSAARTLTALLDLLVLEGIYPSLPAGVGVPLERRARNFSIPASRKAEDRRDVALLGDVVGGLLEVLGAGTAETGETGVAGVAGVVRARCMVDLLAGCGELAFGAGGTEAWRQRWWALVESTPTPVLLPPLLSLLHPSTPASFRTPLTRALSAIPHTRPHAVRHILTLFLTSAAGAPSLDALSNASRIIGAVPASVSPGAYFAQVCPQLLALLDDDAADPAMRRAAAYVLAELLGRKGPVEAVVEREVVAPILRGMVPAAGTAAAAAAAAPAPPTSSSALLDLEDAPRPARTPRFSLVQEIPAPEDAAAAAAPLIPEHALSQTLTRLSTLLTAHPSPSVPHRLLTPLLVPLWALCCHAAAASRSTWHTRALSLLHTHVKTSAAAAPALATLHAHLLSGGGGGGGADWHYGAGAGGGVEVRAGARDAGIAEVDARVAAFVALLAEAPGAAVAEFFVGVLRGWLLRRGGEGGEPLRMLVDAKVLREVIARFEGVLAASPGQALQIVAGVVGEYRLWLEEAGERGGDAEAQAAPSLGGLGRIVVDAPPPPVKREKEQRRYRFVGEEEEEEDEEEEDEEDMDEAASRAQTAALALSLLSVLVSSPDTKLAPPDTRLLQSLQPAVLHLSAAARAHPDIAALATNLLPLLTLHAPAAASSSSTPPPPLLQQQKETYAQALSHLRDPLVPVRAHGLHLLRTLVLAGAPVVDVPATLALLLATLADPDSFVFLNAVKCLTALAGRHSRAVTAALVAAYVDADERRGLDERLRVGEALLGTVQRLGAALVGDAAECVAGGMVAVVSRRKRRGRGGGAEAWADDEDEEQQDEDEGEGEGEGEGRREKRRREREAQAAIVAGWARGDGRVEDVRVRASALSILGAAIETNAAGLGARALNEAVDVALWVLTLETAAEKAILRRAAVVCVGGVLRALVGAGEEDGGGGEAWRGQVWAVLRGRVGEVRRVLGYVRGADNDGLVREQAGVVGENLEAVVERWMLGAGAGAGAGGQGGQGGRGVMGVMGGRIVEIGDGLRVL